LGAGGDRRAQRVAPHVRVERHVDEAGTCNLDRGDLRTLAQLDGNPLGKVTRLEAGILRERHRRIGREVAMAGRARRLDHDAREIRRRGKNTFRGNGFHYGADVRSEGLENVHVVHDFRPPTGGAA
jgi:hypothetical protein